MFNASLSGTIPASLGDGDLLELMLGSNSFSGSSSAQFAVWTGMKTFSIEHNPLLDWSLQLLSNWTSLERATMQVPAALSPRVQCGVVVCRAVELAVRYRVKGSQRDWRCCCSPKT